MEQGLACHVPDLVDFEPMKRRPAGAQPLKMVLIEGGARMQTRDFVPVPAVCLDVVPDVHVSATVPGGAHAWDCRVACNRQRPGKLPVSRRRCASVMTAPNSGEKSVGGGAWHGGSQDCGDEQIRVGRPEQL